MRPSDEMIFVVRSDGAVYTARCWRDGQLLDSGECATMGAALDIVARKVLEHDRGQGPLGQVP